MAPSAYSPDISIDMIMRDKGRYLTQSFDKSP